MSIPELTDLSRRLGSTDPHDREAQEDNLDELRRVCYLVRRTGMPELAAFLDVAARLVEALAGPGDGFEREEILDIACRVVATVERTLRGDATETPAAATEAELEGPRAPAAPSVWREPIKLGDGEDDAQEPEGGPEPEAPSKANDSVLGRMLVAFGHVTRDQVAQALKMQRAKGLRIGECLLLLGAVSPDRLLQALKLQEHMRAEARAEEEQQQGLMPPKALWPPRSLWPTTAPVAASDPHHMDLRVAKNLFLGEVLLGAEMVTSKQLEQGMHLHHYEGIRLGEALIRIGALTQEDLQSGLELQRQLRNIAGLSRRSG